MWKNSQNNRSIDVFAMSNPAICSLILWAFSSAYKEVSSNGYSLPLLYFPIPIVLSRNITQTMKGTNKKTGWIEWISRNPDLAIKLPNLIQNTKEITIDAIRFALAHNLITINEHNLVIPRANKINSKYQNYDELKTFIKHSDVIGTWLGQIDSTELILQSLGLVL